MRKRIICLFLLGAFLLSGCGRAEKIEMPAVLPEGDAQAYVTRGTYYLNNLDITGDGQIDSVEVVCYGESDIDAGYAKGWDIVINDTLGYDLYSVEYMQPEISFYMLEEKCVYIAIKEYAPGNSDLLGFQLYQYKNDKMKQVCDFYELLEGTTYEDDFYADIVLAQAGTIMLHCQSQFKTVDYPQWYMTYTYDGEWVTDSEVPIGTAEIN